MNWQRCFSCGFLGVCLTVAIGCWSSATNEVVVYAALDREFSEPIFQDFERQTGSKVLAKYDVESTKTVGLVNALIQEKNRPRCDLFWNNEILHTLRLEKLGLLEAYVPDSAAKFPSEFRSPTGTWHGFAARARVLLVNTELVPAEKRPTSVLDLADEQWKGQVGIAKPLFGTTATHAAILFSVLGDEPARHFFQQVHQNARVMSGNKQVATAVGRGQLAFGLTDTDDAISEVDAGRPVAIIFPDQADDQFGTLLIPNTICLLKGAPHADQARKLLAHILSPTVERKLAAGESAQFPLHSDVTEKPRIVLPADIRWMKPDFVGAAAHWDEVARFLRDTFATVD